MIIVEPLPVTLTGYEVGHEVAISDDSEQRQFLAGFAATAKVFGGLWASQCRSIVNGMSQLERDAALSILSVLTDHLEERVTPQEELAIHLARGTEPKPLYAKDDCAPDAESLASAYARLFCGAKLNATSRVILWDYGDGQVSRTSHCIVDHGCDHQELWALEHEAWLLRNKK